MFRCTWKWSQIQLRRSSSNPISTLTVKSLSKGYYLGTVVITDPRGDSYYSAVVGADIGSGGVDEWKIDDRFKASNY